jgi:glycyl-tRNA synthetase
MPVTLESIMELAKRRGFFWPAYEVYGGAAGLYTFGNLGVKLAEKVTSLWREHFLLPNSFVEVDTPNIAPYQVLEASGHVSNFMDPMAECQNCRRKFRADHLIEGSGKKIPEGSDVRIYEKFLIEEHVKCPECGASSWSVRPFMTMFETRLGPYADAVGYLRPETAQGIFVEFRRIFETERERLPLGVGQVGRGFRNEISPRQGIIRLRELHMLELEVFLDPEKMSCPMLKEVADTRLNIVRTSSGKETSTVVRAEEAVSSGLVSVEWLAYMMAVGKRFLTVLGVPEEGQRFKEKAEGERAHYSAQTFDLEVLLGETGWLEVAGFAYRTDFDLSAHSKGSGVDFSVSVQLEGQGRRVVKRWSLNVELLKKLHPENWKEVMRDYERVRERVGETPSSLGGVKLEREVFIVREETVTSKVRRFIPHVVEPSFGLDRLMLATLYFAHTSKDDRTVLKLPPKVAPLSVAVFPLVSKSEMISMAERIEKELRAQGFDTFYDESGSVGRRYARADEAGIPFCLTVDGQSLEDGTVTLRNRDTWEQRRVHRSNLSSELKDSIR